MFKSFITSRSSGSSTAFINSLFIFTPVNVLYYKIRSKDLPSRPSFHPNDIAAKRRSLFPNSNDSFLFITPRYLFIINNQNYVYLKNINPKLYNEFESMYKNGKVFNLDNDYNIKIIDKILKINWMI